MPDRPSVITKVSLPDSPREFDHGPAHRPARLLTVAVGVTVGGCEVDGVVVDAGGNVVVITVIEDDICVVVAGA